MSLLVWTLPSLCRSGKGIFVYPRDSISPPSLSRDSGLDPDGFERAAQTGLPPCFPAVNRNWRRLRRVSPKNRPG